MPTIETIIIFITACVVINPTPSPSILYVMSRSLSQGRKAGFISAMGLATGGLCQSIMAALGLSVVLAYNPFAYMVLKIAANFTIY